MFSPTAIANFLACQHLTALDRAAMAEQIKRPFFADPLLDFLIKLGQAHEQAYLTQLTEQGLTIVEIPTDGSRRDAAAKTAEAIRGGADVIYQATFLADQDAHRGVAGRGLATAPGTDLIPWYGRADFLIRVDKPSDVGAFSYEVVEAKLARSTKARAIIQLCFYSDLLSRIQGVVPDSMHVVLGGGAKPESFFVQRYLAFFRKIKRDFVAAEQSQVETYPEPVEHCRICDWSTVCDEQWRKDDHLSLVANITRNQRQALVAHATETVAGLARLPVPPEPKVEGIKDQAFANIHQQSRLQVQGREERRNIYELLVPPETGKGLCSLPAPSPGDIFLDFEGDQFTFEGGLEYLFGVLTVCDFGLRISNCEINYEATWAMNPAEEKRAFQRFIKMVTERRRLYPDMHIYHYGSYEETAIKRMAGQHSTCVDEVDELLRGDVLVDMLRGQAGITGVSGKLFD